MYPLYIFQGIRSRPVGA